MAKVTEVGGGVSPLFWLFLLFLGLKLTGNIAWSWWWVTAPLWAAPFILGVIGIFVFVGVLLFNFFSNQRYKNLKS